MPGHMNVLLAEADVRMNQLLEMEVNPDLPNTDVLMVMWRHDVVNPAARIDPCSPIAGMPIIKAHEAKNIIVMKRGRGKGYAGIENMHYITTRQNVVWRCKTLFRISSMKPKLMILYAQGSEYYPWINVIYHSVSELPLIDSCLLTFIS